MALYWKKHCMHNIERTYIDYNFYIIYHTWRILIDWAEAVDTMTIYATYLPIWLDEKGERRGKKIVKAERAWDFYHNIKFIVVKKS